MTYGNSEGEGNLGLDWMSSESFTNVAYWLYKSGPVIVTKSYKDTFNVMFHNIQHGENASFAKQNYVGAVGGYRDIVMCL